MLPLHLGPRAVPEEPQYLLLDEVLNDAKQHRPGGSGRAHYGEMISRPGKYVR